MAATELAVPAATRRKTMRCAIYTRKSTEEGLEQTFNTLDAQRDAAEAYVRSQREEGWTALVDKYDDGGYTGANMDRPALKKMLQDVRDGWRSPDSPTRSPISMSRTSVTSSAR